MNSLKKIILIFLFFLVLPLATVVQAASLNFDKTTVSVANGGTFQIAVTVDPGADSIISTDAYVSFDSTLLKATTVTAGTLFETVSHDESTAGKVYIAGLVKDASSAVTAAGTVATITFQALKDGTGTLSFDCNTSKIIKNDINASNVISCSQNGTAAVTIGSCSQNGTTTGDCRSNQPTSSTPTQLPQSGIFENVVKFAFPGSILLILGSVLRLIL